MKVDVYILHEGNVSVLARLTGLSETSLMDKLLSARHSNQMVAFQVDLDPIGESEEHLAHMLRLKDKPCPVCQGPSRETTNLVCQHCGRDYALGYRPLPTKAY